MLLDFHFSICTMSDNRVYTNPDVRIITLLQQKYHSDPLIMWFLEDYVSTARALKDTIQDLEMTERSLDQVELDNERWRTDYLNTSEAYNDMARSNQRIYRRFVKAQALIHEMRCELRFANGGRRLSTTLERTLNYGILSDSSDNESEATEIETLDINTEE